MSIVQPEFTAVPINETASEADREISVSNQVTDDSSNIDSRVTEVVAQQLPRADQNPRPRDIKREIQAILLIAAFSGGLFYAGASSSPLFYFGGGYCAGIVLKNTLSVSQFYCRNRPRQG